MPGFFITNTNKVPRLINYDNNLCFCGEFYYNEWTIKWNSLNKYVDDKVFFQNDRYIIVLDGVILNKRLLMKKYHKNFWQDTILEMLENNNETFFIEFRGVFAGAILDKSKNKWIIYTDQCGSRLLLSYCKDNKVAIGSQLNYFKDWMNDNNINIKIDNCWVKDFFSFGYTIDKRSIISNVHRVYPGCYQIIEKGEIQKFIYYRIKKENINRNISAEQAIDILDKLFIKAIEQIIKKDQEYGYKTIFDISGGLDSRMNIGVAVKYNESKIKDILAITFAQKNSLDDIISSEISELLNLDHIYYFLDGGNCLTDIDDLVFMNQGFNFYLGATGIKRFLSIIDKKIYGMSVVGILGDIYEGAMITDGEGEVNWNYNRFRTSKKINVTVDGNREEFDDNEILWFYIRGILAGMNTGFIRQNFVEPITPYGNVEFMNFCFSLPYKMRVKQHIYRQWMIKKYPHIANIKYSGTEFPVSLHDKFDWFKVLPLRIKRRLYRAIWGQKKEWSMNPFDIWYEENIVLREYIQKYYKDNIELLNFDKNLKQNIVVLFEKGNMLERSMALTLISAVKQFILK